MFFIGRDCLIPDVSRTYHFGEVGLNVNEKMQTLYFRHHALHKSSLPVKFKSLESLIKTNYDTSLKYAISMSKFIDEAARPCDEQNIKRNLNFGPDHDENVGESMVLYFAQVKNLTNVRKSFF